METHGNNFPKIQLLGYPKALLNILFRTMYLAFRNSKWSVYSNTKRKYNLSKDSYIGLTFYNVFSFLYYCWRNKQKIDDVKKNSVKLIPLQEESSREIFIVTKGWMRLKWSHKMEYTLTMVFSICFKYDHPSAEDLFKSSRQKAGTNLSFLQSFYF